MKLSPRTVRWLILGMVLFLPAYVILAFFFAPALLFLSTLNPITALFVRYGLLLIPLSILWNALDLPYRVRSAFGWGQALTGTNNTRPLEGGKTHHPS